VNTVIDFDLNNPTFQKHLLALQKDDLYRFSQALVKIKQMTWQQVYQDKGLNWELVSHRLGPKDQRLYTIRISQKFRVLVYREENFMRFLSLHPDHDSAYQQRRPGKKP
jgi:hypothetical protein